MIIKQFSIHIKQAYVGTDVMPSRLYSSLVIQSRLHFTQSR